MFAAVISLGLALGACGCQRGTSAVAGTSTNFAASTQSTASLTVAAESEQSALIGSASSNAPVHSSVPGTASRTGSAFASSKVSSKSTSSKAVSSNLPVQSSRYLKGVWLSCYDIAGLGVKGMNASAFKQKAAAVMKNVRSAGYNTVFCHVRAFGDAYYPSKYFPFTAAFTGVAGQSPGYDPLAILLQAAKANGLAFHAWINPYRVRLNKNSPELSDNDPAKKWLVDGSENACYAGNGIYYNPGSAAVRQLVLNGVEEILKNYKVDGIHFDDYFYPTTGAEFDQKTYAASGKKTTLENWRRNNVNILISSTWRLCKKYGVKFGVSPSGHLPNGYNDKNYTQQYADLKLWLTAAGYVDYLAPQLYWGYSNPTKAVQYAELLKGWCSLKRAPGVQLYIGLAGYKIGSTNAADKADYCSGNLLARQTKDAAAAGCSGVINFSYGDLVKTDAAHQSENKALKLALEQLK